MTSWIPKMTTWVFSSVVKGKFLQLLNLMLVQTWMTGNTKAVLKNIGNQTVLVTVNFHYGQGKKHIKISSVFYRRKSNRFGMTWGWMTLMK